MRYYYEIIVRGYPGVLRRCPRCGRTRSFYPSGQIRINAQKKLLDVWLIHKCRDCGQTWNMEVYARVSPHSLPKNLYEKLLTNDRALIDTMAFDRQLHAEAGVTMDFDALEYEIKGERIDPDALREEAELILNCEVPTGMRLSRIVREILGLSQKRYEALVTSGAIIGADGQDLLKGRMGTECLIRVKIP